MGLLISSLAEQLGFPRPSCQEIRNGKRVTGKETSPELQSEPNFSRFVREDRPKIEVGDDDNNDQEASENTGNSADADIGSHSRSSFGGGHELIMILDITWEDLLKDSTFETSAREAGAEEKTSKTLELDASATLATSGVVNREPEKWIVMVHGFVSTNKS
ncbi:unnamed protein product [Orchesella dallaii]|uniref:Uncharacterized protein n=1 Tax=Orchesella dallaii TaxID=48710 RepID=A0ABP1R9H4_9HEXA